MTSALADIFVFTPASTVVNEDQVKVWVDKTTSLIETASGGYKKQLELQRQWFLDSKSGEAE